MLLSKLFGKTVKDVDSQIALVSHKLLYQGGFIRESTAGRYYFLPLGIRVHDKISRIVEDEMDGAGAQKLITPTLHPLELWQETNRTSSVGFELMTVADQRGAKFALGGTAEEMIVDLVRKYTVSYKDLPFNIYQFSQKFRDEKRARGGLLRVREFLMKDAYSFHANEEDFKKEYQNMWDAYTRIFERCGLRTTVVEADNGYIGGDYCHEFVVESEVGESRYFVTDDGSYAAHEDVARFEKDAMNLDEEARDMEVVKAVRGVTMEDGVALHNLPLWRQIKDVLYKDENGRFVLAIIRGDLDVNETKLKHLAHVHQLEMATDEDIREKLHSEPGFISPIGIKDDLADGVELLIVADDSLLTVKNAYGGANEKHFDRLNVNIGRDFMPDVEGDIAMPVPGMLATGGKALEARLTARRGIEVGNIFQLGTHYSRRMAGAVFVDENNKELPYYMGCYGIGIGRTLGTIVEIHHDDKGIIWPEAVAPYRVHLLHLGKDEAVQKAAEKLYEDLQAAGVEVLFDDRNDSPGKKLADADLIGIPYRVLVSNKTLEKNSAEIKKRAHTDANLVLLSAVISSVA